MRNWKIRTCRGLNPGLSLILPLACIVYSDPRMHCWCFVLSYAWLRLSLYAIFKYFQIYQLNHTACVARVCTVLKHLFFTSEANENFPKCEQKTSIVIENILGEHRLAMPLALELSKVLLYSIQKFFWFPVLFLIAYLRREMCCPEELSL